MMNFKCLSAAVLSLMIIFICSYAYSNFEIKGYAKCILSINKEEYNIALEICTPLAEEGNSEIQYYLGGVYFRAPEPIRNYTTAFYWTRKAGDQGFKPAYKVLGTMYHFGFGTDINLDKAGYYLNKAAVEGDTESQYELGTMYISGEIKPIDNHDAMYWFSKAAEKGHADAQFRLGAILVINHSNNEELKQGIDLLKRAAASGHADAKDFLLEWEKHQNND